MKRILTVVFFLTGVWAGFAQAPKVASLEVGEGKLSGTVFDSATQKPVEFATVALMKSGSETPVNGSVCDENGKFVIKDIEPGMYTAVISFIGYEPKRIPVAIPDKNNDIQLGKIFISVTAEILKEVTVEGQKALIEEKVDRTIYNAENDLTAKGGDASDVLRRVPMLTVDLDGNVSLRGNQNIQVLINNKPSTIVASNIGDALKQIPADQIKTVEVITSPSAKYDAEGSAGIINIITKKNNLEGLTLNVDAGVGLRGSNLGLNGNYRKGKMGFSLGGFGRANYNTTGEFTNEQVTFPGTEQSIRSTQSADTYNQGLFGNYTLGFDYDINEKTFITSSIRYGVRDFRREQNDFLSENYDYQNTLLSRNLSEVLSKDASHNVDATLTFTKQYAVKQKELSFQGQYSRNNQTSRFSNTPLESTNPISIANTNDSYNQEITMQVDFQTPLGEKQLLEVGGKDIMRKVFSDYATSGNSQTGSNNLNYDQNVVAAYSSLTQNFNKGYSMKAGIRYEYTIINAYSQTDDDIEIPAYGVFVPSVNFSKKLKNSNTLKISYNRRIQRPSIRYLNPNQQFQNNLNVTVGNPELNPEYTNNFELGYSTFIKGTSLNFTAFVRNTNDAIQSIREPLEEAPNVIRTTYENIGLENAYGSSIFANVNVGKLTLNGGGDVYYAVLDNKNPDEYYHYQNEGWVVSGRIFGSYNLDKGWALQFFGFGRGRNVQLQGYQGNFRMYSLGVRKEFNDKKGSIGVGAENFLNTNGLKMKSETISRDMSQYSVNTMNNLSFRLTFSYRIGKMSMDQRANRRRSINNDDLKEGGDNGGGGMEGGGGAQMGGGQNRGNFGGARGGAPAAGAAAPAKNDKMVQADSAAVVNPEGTWEYTVESPQGGAGVFVIKKEGTGLAGMLTDKRMQKETPLKDIKLTGNALSFSYEVNFGGNTVPIQVSGTINGTDFNGNIAIGQFGNFPMNGIRKE